MNRYLFWLLMVLPWITVGLYVKQSNEDAYLEAILLSIVLYLCLILNIRRNYVGLSIKETVKAVIPGIGYKEWQHLYFAK